MNLTQIAGGDCGRDDCPTIFTTDHDMVVVQGYFVEKQTPTGEGAVEIPLTLLQEAIGALGG
jgi:hypothetical protein